MYLVYRNCVASRVDLCNCFKSVVKPNAINHSTFSSPKLHRLVNVQKLQASNVEDKIEKEETCRGGTVVGNKLEDVCLPGDEHQCTAIRYFTQKSIKDRNARVSTPHKQSEKKYSKKSKMDGPDQSIYNARTRYLADDIRQKLSWIRFTEYTRYGEELLKTNKLKSIQNELLTVATYNVLSQELLEKHGYLYQNHDHRSLHWNLRSEILREELSLLDADILCLQEVDSHLVEWYYNRYLRERGYQGVYKRRTHGRIDGCAIYFRNRDNVGIILKLSLKDRPEVEFVVATTHLLYNPKRSDIRLVQTQVMLAEIEKLAYKRTDSETGQPEYLPIIFTGDMNYSPNSAIYELVTKGHFEYEGMNTKYLSSVRDGYMLNKTLLPPAVGVTDSCQYASALSERKGETNAQFGTGVLDHRLNLSSAYTHFKGDHPEATTNQDTWLTVDYIFYSQSQNHELKSKGDGNLKLVSKLTLPNSQEGEEDLRSIPNLGCASDHLPLLATFHLTGS